MPELYLGIRGNMNVMRSKLVSKAFDYTLMTDENSVGGAISLHHVKEAYSADWMPDVQVQAKRSPPLTNMPLITWLWIMLTNLTHTLQLMTIPSIQVWQSAIR